ncbi:MAG TPA: RNA polymerase sigma factor [Ktedonobacterales bacterium]|jgi:RNA polymerase sigma-70 factor (ECF subfamily)|nr:RNA polymerase sigma factor [Ktedonobacterales bacterium]
MARRLVFARESHISDSPPTPGGTDASGAHPVERPTLRALAAQPEADYDAFVREHQRAILNYLWRMLGDEQSAYDLTQEVFVRAWRHFDTLRGYTSPRAWLFRVATNLAVSSLRGRRPLSSVDLLPADQQPAMSDPAWRVVERDLVRAALDTLPPRRRAALTLREVYGLSCAEVARALGISAAAARMTLSRAREQFREAYLREGGDQHDA